jgi:hypothetical protein
VTQTDLFPATLKRRRKEPCPYTIERVGRWCARRKVTLYYRVRLGKTVVNNFLTKKAAKSWIHRQLHPRGIHPSWLP